MQELQKKFKHFQRTDNRKFRDIWKMNEEDAKDFMRKALQADRIIFEQQLGMEWKSPKDDLFRNVDPNYFEDEDDRENLIEQAHLAFEQEIEERLADENLDVEKRESLTLKFQEHKQNSPLVKNILELLCNGAGFLVEDKLQKLLAPLHPDEQLLMRLDSIFKALGVDNIADVERLTRFFVVKDQQSNETLIHPNAVISSIREYFDSVRKEVHNDEAEQLVVEKDVPTGKI